MCQEDVLSKTTDKIFIEEKCTKNPRDIFPCLESIFTNFLMVACWICRQVESTLNFLLYSVYWPISHLLLYFCDRIYVDVAPDLAQEFHVLGRRRKFEIDIARPKDFLIAPRRVMPVSELLNPRYSIYTIANGWVYFVYGPTLRECTVREYPFMNHKQFYAAERLARCRAHAFLRLCSTVPRAKIVYMSTVPRGGSTLVLSMLQSTDNIYCLAEPDALSILGAQRKNGAERDIKELRALLLSVISHLCRELTENDICVIKPLYVANYLCEDVTAVIPHVKLIYTDKRNMKAVLGSIHKLARLMFSSTDRCLGRYFNMPYIYIGYFDCGITKVEARSTPLCDHAFTVLASAIAPYYATRDRLTYRVVVYEELLEDPRQTAKSLLEYVGITRVTEAMLDSAVQCLQGDSQIDTMVSMRNMKRQPDVVFPNTVLADYNNRLLALGCDALF